MISDCAWPIVAFIYIVHGCQEGYFDDNCTKPCSYPTFGERCKQACICTQDSCDHRTGCSQSQICKDGYYGPECNFPCRYPSYGRKCQKMCLCHLNDCNHIKGCQNITDVFEMTTLFENVSEKEVTLMNKYQETVIIGSTGLFVFVIITICVNLMVKFNVCKSNIRDEETNTKPHIYFACPVDNVARRLSYTSLELNENYNPDAYKNPSKSHVDNDSRMISNTKLELNESYYSGAYKNTPNGPVDNTTSRKSYTSLKSNESYNHGAYENKPNGSVDNTTSRKSYTGLKSNESYNHGAYENTSNGPVDNTTGSRKSYTTLKSNESYDHGAYENTPKSLSLV